MKVLQVLPALESGGVERGTLEIAEALILEGHDSIVVSSGGPLVDTLEAQGSQHFSLPAQSKNPFHMLLNGMRIAKLVELNRIELIHARSRAPAWSCLLASKLTGTPLISTFHGQYGHQNSVKKLYNSGMLRGKYCIAVSDFIREHIENHYPNHQAKLETIHRGIDTSYFDVTSITGPRINQLQSAWRLPIDSKPVIMLPGRLTRLKGHGDFIQALSMLPAHSFRAVIVGATENRDHYYNQLQGQVRRLNIEQDIHFVGPCDDMPAAYCLADIVVSASTKPEAFGRTLCEAQAMGRLIVASQHGGAEETTYYKQRQGLYEAGKPSALANAISNQLALSQEHAHQIGTESRQHIAESFSLERMCQRTLALYERVLNQNRPAT